MFHREITPGRYHTIISAESLHSSRHHNHRNARFKLNNWKKFQFFSIRQSPSPPNGPVRCSTGLGRFKSTSSGSQSNRKARKVLFPSDSCDDDDEEEDEDEEDALSDESDVVPASSPHLLLLNTSLDGCIPQPTNKNRNQSFKIAPKKVEHAGTDASNSVNRSQSFDSFFAKIRHISLAKFKKSDDKLNSHETKKDKTINEEIYHNKLNEQNEEDMATLGLLDHNRNSVIKTDDDDTFVEQTDGKSSRDNNEIAPMEIHLSPVDRPQTSESTQNVMNENKLNQSNSPVQDTQSGTNERFSFDSSLLENQNLDCSEVDASFKKVCSTTDSLSSTSSLLTEILQSTSSFGGDKSSVETQAPVEDDPMSISMQTSSEQCNTAMSSSTVSSTTTTTWNQPIEDVDSNSDQLLISMIASTEGSEIMENDLPTETSPFVISPNISEDLTNNNSKQAEPEIVVSTIASVSNTLDVETHKEVSNQLRFDTNSNQVVNEPDKEFSTTEDIDSVMETYKSKQNTHEGPASVKVSYSTSKSLIDDLTRIVDPTSETRARIEMLKNQRRTQIRQKFEQQSKSSSLAKPTSPSRIPVAKVTPWGTVQTRPRGLPEVVNSSSVVASTAPISPLSSPNDDIVVNFNRPVRLRHKNSPTKILATSTSSNWRRSDVSHQNQDTKDLHRNSVPNLDVVMESSPMFDKPKTSLQTSHKIESDFKVPCEITSPSTSISTTKVTITPLRTANKRQRSIHTQQLPFAILKQFEQESSQQLQ